jgi:hypothetical protein
MISASVLFEIFIVTRLFSFKCIFCGASSAIPGAETALVPFVRAACA